MNVLYKAEVLVGAQRASQALSRHHLRATTQLVSLVVRLQLTERVRLPGYSVSSSGGQS